MVDIARPNDKSIEGVSVKHPMGLHQGTLILMADHSYKAIGSVQVGEKIFLGGLVTNTIKDKSVDMYTYKGIEVTGNMKLMEDGRWIKVEESQQNRQLTNMEPEDICILQSEIKLMMTTDYQIWSTNLEDVTEELNTKHSLNKMLASHMSGLK
jgi:hypothetical protein